MDNPYWTSENNLPSVDINEIKKNCFNFLNIIKASRGIAEELQCIEDDDFNEEEDEDHFYFNLHRELSEIEISKLLISLAINLRIFDDIMLYKVDGNLYKQYRDRTSGINYIGYSSDAQEFDLRGACNKVLHASSIRPIYERLDEMGNIANQERKFWYLTSEIELKGFHKNKEWNAVLHAYEFIEIILERIKFIN